MESDIGLWTVPLAILGGAIRVSTPFIFVSLGETITERSGRINLGLEGTLVFGAGQPAPAVTVTVRDVRCMMINLDPDTATQDARVMKTVVRQNENTAGVYGTVVQTGIIRVGDPVGLVS